MIEPGDVLSPLGQKRSLGTTETTFAMSAIPPELFTEILQEIAYNASGMFCQLTHLSDPLHVVSLPDLEALRHFTFQFRRVRKPRFSAVTLPESCHL